MPSRACVRLAASLAGMQCAATSALHSTRCVCSSVCGNNNRNSLDCCAHTRLNAHHFARAPTRRPTISSHATLSSSCAARARPNTLSLCWYLCVCVCVHIIGVRACSRIGWRRVFERCSLDFSRHTAAVRVHRKSISVRNDGEMPSDDDDDDGAANARSLRKKGFGIHFNQTHCARVRVS